MEAIIIGAIGLFLAFFFQRKKYNISYARMVILYAIFTLSGGIGAKFGSLISIGSMSGQRLYGLILTNIMVVSLVSRLMKMESGTLGDYVAVPNMVGCATAKLECLRSNCCYGCVLFTNASGVDVRFPSKWVEIGMWTAMAIWLLYMEKKQRGNMLRWPITVIWFGILRFIADLFRGSPNENKPFLLGFPAGQFWSIVVFLAGTICLYISIRKYWHRKPSIKEMVCVCIGIEPKS